VRREQMGHEHELAGVGKQALYGLKADDRGFLLVEVRQEMIKTRQPVRSSFSKVMAFYIKVLKTSSICSVKQKTIETNNTTIEIYENKFSDKNTDCCGTVCRCGLLECRCC
jgi:hypothetical protein